jgi:uncharacterized protein (TIGR00730 family)
MAVHEIKSLAVFCGANAGSSTSYSESAKDLADAMCDAGITLVYGGAKVGLMGVIADQMLKNGARVIGVMPKSLVDIESAHTGLSDFHVVATMQERKNLIAELSDGFITLPGGIGSLDEFFEMITLEQLGYHQKPSGILNAVGYYDHLLEFLDHAVVQGFFKKIYRDRIIVDASPRSLLKKLTHFAM